MDGPCASVKKREPDPACAVLFVSFFILWQFAISKKNPRLYDATHLVLFIWCFRFPILCGFPSIFLFGRSGEESLPPSSETPFFFRS